MVGDSDYSLEGLFPELEELPTSPTGTVSAANDDANAYDSAPFPHQHAVPLKAHIDMDKSHLDLSYQRSAVNKEGFYNIAPPPKQRGFSPIYVHVEADSGQITSGRLLIDVYLMPRKDVDTPLNTEVKGSSEIAVVEIEKGKWAANFRQDKQSRIRERARSPNPVFPNTFFLI